MTQHKQETDALTTSINSQGSAMRENSKYLDSMQSKINQMKNSFVQLGLALGKAFVNSGIVDVVTGLTGLASAGVHVVQVFGGLPTVITAAYVAFMLFGGTATKYVTTMAGVNAVTGKFNSIFGSVRATLAITKSEVEAATVGMSGLQRGLVATGTAAKTFGILFRSALSATGVGLAIVAVSYALEKLVGAISAAHKAHVQEQKDLETSAQNYQNNSKQIDGMIATYDKLDKLKNTTGLNNDQQKQYLDIQNQIAEVMPTVVAGQDANGNSIIVSSKALKANIDLLKQKIQLDHEDAVANAPSDIQKSSSSIDDYQQQINDKKKQLQEIEKQLKDINSTSPSSSNSYLNNAEQQNVNAYTDQERKIKEDILSIEQKINSEQSKQEKTVSNILSYYKSLSNSDDTWITKMVTDGKLSTDQIDVLAKTISDLRSNLGKSLPSNFFSGMSETEIKTLSNLIGEYKNGSLSIVTFTKDLENSGLSASKTSDLIGILSGNTDKVTNSTKKASDTIKDFSSDLSDASKYASLLGKTLGGLKVDKNGNLIDQGQQLNELINTYQILNDMQNNGDKLDTDQTKLLNSAIQELTKSYPALMDGKKLNVDAAKKEADANSTLVDAYNKAAQGLLTDEQQMTLAKINQTQARIAELEKEVEALDVAKKAYDDYVNSVQSELDAGSSVDLARAQAIASGMKSSLDSSSLSNYKSELKSLQGNLDTYTSSLKKSMDAGNSSTETTTKQKYVVDKYTDSLNKLNEQQKILENLQQRYDQNSQKYRDAISAEVKVLQQKEDLLKSQASSLNKQISSGNIQQTGLVSTTYTTTTSGTSSASGSSTAAQIWNYLAGKGLNAGAIAGIMGNLQQESGLSTTAVNPSSGAYGLAQWLGSRKTGLQNYASSQGLSASSLSAQLDYLWKELSSGGNGSVSAINGMSASQAAAYFEQAFERAGSGAVIGTRQKYADNFYSQYANGSAGTTSKTTAQGSSKAEKQQAVDQAKQQVLDIDGQISDIQAQIKQLNFQIVQSKLNEFEATQTKYDNNISSLKDMEGRLNTTSTAYRDNINQQTDALKKKQASIQDEIKYAEKEERDTNLSAEAHLQLKQKVDQLKVSLSDLTVQIKENDYAVVQSNIDKYQQSIDALNHSLTLSKSAMSDMTEGTSQYNTEVKTQIDLLRKQQQVNQQEQAYIQKEIKDTGLSAAQHQELNQTLQQLTETYADLQSQVTSYYTNLASTVTDLYKSAYQDQEQAALDANQKEQDAAQKTHDQIIQNLSDEEDAYQKKIQAQMDAIDQQDSDTSYQDDLASKQKTVQDLQNQINVMSLDNSAEGQKKLADLQSQLADAQKDVSDAVAQHESDLRKQNLQDQLDSYQADIDAKKTAEDDKLQSTQDELNAERDAIQKNWDNIINDDEKYTQIQEDIISGHFDNITKDLEGFKTNLESISSDIGDSLTKNLIDQINNAEDAMDKLNGTSATSGKTSSSTSSSSSSKSTSSSSSSKSSSSSSSSTKSSSTPKASTTQYYTVKEGDTLSEIAEKYYGHGTKTYYEKIAKANNLSDADMIKIGQRLKIPSLAVGGVVTDPTLILAGDAGKGNPEIYAPQKLMTDIVNNGLYNAISKMPLIQALNNLLPKVSNNQTTSQGDTYLNVNIANMNGTKQDVNNFFSAIKNEWNKRGLLT